MQDLLNYLYTLLEKFGINILIALITLIIGKFVIQFLMKLTSRLFNSRGVDAAVASFVKSLLYALLWTVLIIMVLSKIGVQTTSFVAILGAAGLAVGLALQGSLSNFAAGFLIIMFRPFNVGDVVEVCGISGTVKSIKMIQSEIISFDNRLFIIPNNQIMNSVITNVTAEEFRRVDFVFTVCPSSNIQKVKDVIGGIINAHNLAIKDDNSKPVIIRLSNISRDALDFSVRVWCKTPDYWPLYFDLTEQIKVDFDKNGIVFPLPQMEIRTVGDGPVRPAPDFVGDGPVRPANVGDGPVRPANVGDGPVRPVSDFVGDGPVRPAPDFVGDGPVRPAPDIKP